ncbi:MAG: ATP-binding protein, partial [Usitatibacteraceae bacterium]
SHDAELLEAESGDHVREARIVNTDGREFETIVARKLLRRADGSVDGIIGTITDVTLIKKLERELARQREQLDLVIRSSQQGIWDLEFTEGRASYYSGRFREILGYPPGKFPEDFDWRENIHPDDYEEVRRRVVAHFKGFTSLFDIESRIRRWGGNYMWVSVRAIAQRNAEGRAIRFVGSIADVTDRKEAEVALTEANVRVTEAARAKEAFLATMSHEIRTPMNGVLGITSLLNETNLNDEQRDYIRLIRASGDTLLRLIDDVLDFSKIESGRMTLESVPVEIVTVAEDAFELVAEKARDKDLALLFEIDDSVPFYLQGDATRLRQILLNLLSNAIKFTDKGEIKLHLLTRRNAEGQLVLEGRVSDTGIGIPAERARKLFQPFTQVDASTTRKYGGTGLGLAIVRRLSQLMGGDVSVESIEGLGSMFTFSLLTSEAEGLQKPYMHRDLADFLGKRMLLVDRNANRLRIQAQQYKLWGFETVTASREQAANAFARGSPFDLMVIDMELSSPETAAMRDALEADDRQRQQRGQAPVIVILMSAMTRAELSQRQIAPALRHSAFVMRPAGRAKMFDVLTRALVDGANPDVATRPYTLNPVYDSVYREASWISHATAGSKQILVDPPDTARREIPAMKLGERPLRILVAEDNEINQQVIQGMLKSIGCDSDLAEDGVVAVDKAVGGQFDVILMDIHMPRLDGVTAMQNIRRARAGKICPPIVAVTAHALPGDREHYLSMGMNDYISKPIRPGELKSLLERLFPGMAAPPVQAESRVTAPVPASNPLPTAEQPPILDIEQLEDLRYLPAAAGAAADVPGSAGGLIRLYQTKTIERLAEMQTLLASA